MRLVNVNTKIEVKVGDVVTMPNGQPATVLGIERPRHSGSTGRVQLNTGSFYPSVIDAEWTEREDQAEKPTNQMTAVEVADWLHGVGSANEDFWRNVNTHIVANDVRYAINLVTSHWQDVDFPLQLRILANTLEKNR